VRTKPYFSSTLRHPPIASGTGATDICRGFPWSGRPCPAHKLGQRGSSEEEETMHSLRVATGMTGLLVVTTILFLAQFVAGGTMPVMP